MNAKLIPLAPPAPPQDGLPVHEVNLAPGNKLLHEALAIALAAIFLLDEAGTTVRDIDVRGGKPVLRIDKPPRWVRGVRTVRLRNGRYQQSLFAAPFHGAQLEWETHVLRERTA